MMKPIDCYDLYASGKHYDCLIGDYSEDIPFYTQLIEIYGTSMLELACGTGRISLEIAKRGYDVTGLDISEAMLNEGMKKAAEKKIKMDFVLGDCRNFELGRKFNLIIFPFNSITHLHDRMSLESMFKSVKTHLFSQGRFIIDVFVPDFAFLTRDNRKRFPVGSYRNPDMGNGDSIIVTESNEYDSATQINHIKWYYTFNNITVKITENNMRMFFPQELDALLHYNGFDVDHKYGDYQLSLFTNTSRKQLIVAKMHGAS